MLEENILKISDDADLRSNSRVYSLKLRLIQRHRLAADDFSLQFPDPAFTGQDLIAYILFGSFQENGNAVDLCELVSTGWANKDAFNGKRPVTANTS